MSKYQLYKKSLAPTGADILGPFYRPGSPFRTKLADKPTLCLSGTVKDTEGNLIENCYIEFWQADESGKYEEAGSSFRGIQKVTDGLWCLETIKPGFYDISEPGSPQPHEFRCSHIHVKVWVNGIDVLTTQLYFTDSEYDDVDHWFNKDRCFKINAVDKLGIAYGSFDLVVKLP